MTLVENSTETEKEFASPIGSTEDEVVVSDNQTTTSHTSATYHKYHDRKEREEKEAAKGKLNPWYKVDITPSYQENLANFKRLGIRVYTHGFSKFHNRYKIIHDNPEYHITPSEVAQ